MGQLAQVASNRLIQCWYVADQLHCRVWRHNWLCIAEARGPSIEPVPRTRSRALKYPGPKRRLLPDRRCIILGGTTVDTTIK